MAVIKYKDLEGNWRKLTEGTKVSVDSELSATSTNPIQNKPVTEAIHQLDVNKQDKLISGTHLKTINNQSILVEDGGETNLSIAPSAEVYTLYPLSYDTETPGADQSATHSTMYKSQHTEAFNAVMNGVDAVYEFYLNSRETVLVSAVTKDEENNKVTFTSEIIDDEDKIVKTILVIDSEGNIDSDATDKISIITLNSLNPLLAAKQDLLVDGTNIKTINGESILITGDSDTNNISVQASLESEVDIKALQSGNTKESLLVEKVGEGILKFKTINNESIIGEGNITASSGGSSYDDSELQNRINELQNTKQDLLVSGTNIKTINNQSILGEGNINIEGGEGGGEPVKILREVLAEGDSIPADAAEGMTIADYNMETIALVREGKAIPVMDGVLPKMYYVDSYGSMDMIFEMITYELGDAMGALVGDVSPVGMKIGYFISIDENGVATVPDSSGMLTGNTLLPKCIDPGLPTFNLDIFGFDMSMLEGLGDDLMEACAEICAELSASPVDPDTSEYEVIYGIDGAIEGDIENADLSNIPSPERWKGALEGSQAGGWFDTEEAAAASGATIKYIAYSSYVQNTDTGEYYWTNWTVEDYVATTEAAAEIEGENAVATDDSSGDSPDVGGISMDSLLSISKSIFDYYTHISMGSYIGMLKGGVMDLGFPTAFVNPMHTIFNIMKIFPQLQNDIMAPEIPGYDNSKINPEVLALIGDELAEKYYNAAVKIVSFYMSDNGPFGELMNGGMGSSESASMAMFTGMFFSSSMVQHVAFGEGLPSSTSSSSYFPAALDVQYSYAGATFIRHYLLDMATYSEDGSLGYTMFFDEILASSGGGNIDIDSLEIAPEIFIGNTQPTSEDANAVIWINPDGEYAGITPSSSVVVCDGYSIIGTATSGVTYIRNVVGESSDTTFKVLNYGESGSNISHYTFHLKGVTQLILPESTIWANGLIPESFDPNNIYEVDVYGTKFGDTTYYKATYAVFEIPEI